MIKTFKCAETEALFNRQRVARFVNIESVAHRKLEQLNSAAQVDDLRVPPGNRLEALKGDRALAVQHPRERSVPGVFPLDGHGRGRR